MAEYNSLAALRGALSSNDAEQRSKAYEAVLSNTDVKPTEVMGDSPPQEALQEAGVIPEEESDTPPAFDLDTERNELLKAIKDALEGN